MQIEKEEFAPLIILLKTTYTGFSDLAIEGPPGTPQFPHHTVIRAYLDEVCANTCAAEGGRLPLLCAKMIPVLPYQWHTPSVSEVCDVPSSTLARIVPAFELRNTRLLLADLPLEHAYSPVCSDAKHFLNSFLCPRPTVCAQARLASVLAAQHLGGACAACGWRCRGGRGTGRNGQQQKYQQQQ